MAAVPIDAPMQTNDDLDFWEHRIEAGIENDASRLAFIWLRSELRWK
jgi:hypothetical protein